MKHIKIFEHNYPVNPAIQEFLNDTNYILIKNLPYSGAYNGTSSEITALAKVLDYMEYEKNQNHGVYMNNCISIGWTTNSHPFYVVKVTKRDAESYINFYDYFEFKHEFIGLNLKNKYGL